MSESSYRFTHAITRKPSASVTQGLRAVDTGSPNFEQMQREAALKVITSSSLRTVKKPLLMQFALMISVIMPAGFPKTVASLREAGYEVREINNTECAKIDGGMSCLSLRG